MLSVVVTGRNDAHGYNLHKRIALSLNSVAEALGPDDEIVFVDWNTPDEMPTAIEAIADTLTETCRNHLRVLRVRPAQHASVSGLSHVPLIDAIARNVAIRRVRPETRWILSTSTDVILVARQAGRTLADIVASLEPGLYHLPHFNVPESLWESLDRRDPARAAALCRQWSKTLHLNEIVEADPIVKYDGPGDFQLFPLATAQQLCGFNEEMVLTYHTDSNFAKRAGYLVGPVRSLVEELLLYHCDHYRQISVHHGPVRAENSWRRFFQEVTGPELPRQAEDWGLAGQAIEEISVAPVGVPHIAAALGNVLAPATEPSWATANPGDHFNRLDYRAAHVLPFVADLLDTMPRDGELGVFANSDVLVSGLAEAWPGLGFAHPILVTDPHLQNGSAQIETAAEPEIFDRAAVLLFDFADEGEADPFATPETVARLDAVAESFRRAVARERGRAAQGQAYRQRFIVVNAINTVFERLVTNNLAFTYTPFTGRIRHGTVIVPPDPLATDIASLASWLRPRLNRAGAIPYQEVVDALDLIGEGFAAGLAPPAAAAVIELIDHPRLAAALDAEPERWRRWVAAAHGARPSRQLAGSLAVPLREPALDVPPPLNKLAAIEDWERPGWITPLADNEEAADSANALRRHRSTWELGQLLYVVSRLRETQTIERARVILQSQDKLPVYLSRQVPLVEVVPGGQATRLAALWPPPGVPYDPRRIAALERYASETGAQEPADLIVLPGNVVLGRKLEGVTRVLASADAALKVGGVIALALEVIVAGGGGDDRLPGGVLASGELERLVTRHTGYAPVGASDWSVSAATLDRLAVSGAKSASGPHFVVQIGKVFSTSGVLVWRKESETMPTVWGKLASALAGRLR